MMEKKAVLSALSALSQETRLDVFRLLVQAGPEGLSAGVIAEGLGVAPNTLSFHLAQLNHAGLIVQRRESRSLIYSADYGQMNALMGFLTENCCGLPANAAACGPACAATPEAANHEAPARPGRYV
jgi:DNA-binding transcriptional ArsR family regulator